ncbi:TnsA-like heteromeric transposase endonuclease subunit [Micromonospora sp. NPDC049081]|uniref:TnsA-like heteromeric transposase endonuclease subunit n=1 Tax=Micromonospora sp. NPDC049081 TaxID=3155150 RepID=UPI0033F19462
MLGFPFERAGAVRQFTSRRGQRSFSGLWYFASSDEHVGFESWLERDRLMMLDADPEVVAVSSQPFWLCGQDEDGRSVRHAPDYFFRRRDVTAVVLDVRPDDRPLPSGSWARSTPSGSRTTIDCCGVTNHPSTTNDPLAFHARETGRPR